jgi:8-oxo-dGTP pyrophosphatase MutT (NUDIX family)
METTRHYTATVYVVNDGAVALHEHDRIGKWLPPGGHVDRDELPHEAGLREVREETGLDVTLVAEREDNGSPTVDPLPKPEHVQLADVNVHDGVVGHQHIDLVYYAHAETRAIDPAPGEAPAAEWEWFASDALSDDRFESNVAAVGTRAIETVLRRV